MIERSLYGPEHQAFRDSYQRFADKEIAPHHEAWEEQGFVERALWQRADANGFLCMTMPEQYGGAGADRLYAAAQMEVNAIGGYSGVGFGLHTNIVAPYIERYGTSAQKQLWLPRMALGEVIGAIAMSEPAAGSDLQGIKTTAIEQSDGSFLLNGSKTFITNGWHADLVVVVAKTDPSAGGKGISLFLVERGMPGFEKGKRLQIAIGAVAAAQGAIDQTLAYVKERKVFGTTVASFQHTRFKLAEMQTEVQIAQVFVDKCLQLFGGYGYMWEYPITRAFADARVQRIYGGTNEIMKEVITRSMGLAGK